MQNSNTISYFARTNARTSHRVFGIKQADRLFHMYAIGKTGAGKSTLLETLLMQDIHTGRGCALIDPHGDLAERVMKAVPASHQDRLVYLDAADLNQPYGYNPLRRIAKPYIPLAASGLMDTLRHLWGASAWGVRMEHLLRNILYALLEYGDATLPDIVRLPVDKTFREEVLKRVTNTTIHTFWTKEWARYPTAYKRDACAPIENKIGAFLADPRMHRMFTNPPIDLRVRTLMDEGKILIVNLAKGKLGSDTTRILGALLVGVVSHAAFMRVSISESARRPFFLYVDEFQHFTTETVVSMVSELRKYGVGLILAHQHLHQLPENMRHAVLANMGTVIVFRVGALDAPLMARHMANMFTVDDLVNLPYHDVAISLMIDGRGGKPFSASTLAP